VAKGGKEAPDRSIGPASLAGRGSSRIAARPGAQAHPGAIAEVRTADGRGGGVGGVGGVGDDDDDDDDDDNDDDDDDDDDDDGAHGFMSRSRHIARSSAYGCLRKWVDTNRSLSIEGPARPACALRHPHLRLPLQRA
jgi:hypothetical protein